MKCFLLPTRDMVFMPDVTVPMFLENAHAVQTVNSAAVSDAKDIDGDTCVVLVPQKTTSYPTAAKDLFSVGTMAKVKQILRMPDNSIHIMLYTTAPAKLSNIQTMNHNFIAEAAVIPQKDDSNDPVVTGLRDSIMEAVRRVIRGQNQVELQKMMSSALNFSMNSFIDAIIHSTDLGVEDAVNVLEQGSYFDKLSVLLEKLKIRAKLADIENDISKKVQSSLVGGQKEIFLRERLNAIQKELGEEEEEGQARAISSKIKKSPMPEDVKEKARGELKRLNAMSPYSSESAMIRTYLEELVAMPWGITDAAGAIELDAAKNVLDADHYGMDGVKERIMEHLAVMKKTGKASGTILCLVGAPGVGKTSLGKSVAEALGRKYQRISLGGVTDEAHFRGHRRTYLGSQPGRIMDALKRSGTNNPVIVLDEIDKMGRDFRSDPEAALLEILDPEQNKSFRDHYLEVDFDLSNVMFIATANTLKMSPALLDRMEIIEVPNYSLDEKVEIAKRHLLKTAAMDTGWDANGIKIDDDAIRHLINNYTNESGVRNLRRELTALLRRALYQTRGEADSYEFTIDGVTKLLTNIRPEVGRKIGFRPSTTVRI